MTIKRATIRDVAARAQVSKSLVSLVMTGDARVSDERRERVLEAARELDYRPNLVARSLAGEHGSVVGILVADLHNPVFAEIVDAARIELEEAGIDSLMSSAHLPGAEGSRIDSGIVGALNDLHALGLLVVGSVPDLGTISELVPGVPMVVASALVERPSEASVVRSDGAAGLRIVVDHLVEAGHRSIAHLGGLGGLVAVERAEAYREAMTSHGLDAEIVVEPCDFSEEAGYRAAASVLDGPRRPTAITAVNDLAALGALAAAADRGIRVPEELSVVGYDNTFLAALRQVSLTSVDPDNVAIGRLAARRLLELTQESLPATERLVSPALVVRESSGNAPASLKEEL